MRGRIRFGAVLGLCLAAAAFPVPLLAQWTGEVSGGYAWQDVTGNEDAFITQYGQHQGFVLDAFELTYVPRPGDRETFAVKAWGFGGAEPAQHGSILYRTGCDWTFSLNYDRQSYFYGIAGGDLASRRSKWAIERWKGSVVFDGWSAARLTLDLRYSKKDGYVYRGMFGQNYVVFPTRNNYDQEMKEAAIRIETKTLPVYLSFEQAYARYEREDRWEAAGRYPVFGTSGSTLNSVATPRNDRVNIPSSRLIAAYHNDVVDVSGSLFYSKQSLDSTGNSLAVYDGFDHSGQFRWYDDTAGSATQDTRAGNVDARFHLGAGWSVGFAGDYRDSTQDSSSIGARILRLGRPGGFWQDFVTPVDERGFCDVKDTTGRFDVMKEGFGWAVWAGYLTGARDVSWKREADDPGRDVRRTGDGWMVGGSWSRSPKLRVNAEYEHGTFNNFVFRTDPDLVEKFTFKLTSSLGSGWTIGARARWEWAENPANVALAKRAAQAYGANVSWANKEGSAGLGLTADMLTLKTGTDIFYPGHVPGFSVYNVDLLTVTANGYFTVGKVHLSGDLTRLRDAGSSWPLTNWSADLRAAIDGPKGVQFELFGQYRSYVEDLSSLDNYYARRYGVIIRWRF